MTGGFSVGETTTTYDEAANPNVATQQSTVRQGGEEIVATATSDVFIEDLAKRVRQKGGKDNIRKEIDRLLMQAKTVGEGEGRALAMRESVDALKDMRLRYDEMIVCSFLSEVAAAERQYRGLPRDMIWNVPSLTVTKIVDVLNAAGYYADGKRK